MSQKRKEEEPPDLEEIVPNKKGKIIDCDDISLACMESNIEKVSKLCNKITMDIQESDHVSDSSKSILSDLCEALRTVSSVQKEIVAKISAQSAVAESYVVHNTDHGKKSYSSAAGGQSVPMVKITTATHTRRLPTGGMVQMSLDKQGKPYEKSKPQEKPAETPEETKKRKFAEAIKEAEKSTLCFNLNMGNVPLQNKDTIQEKAALALTSMAAKKENRSNNVPSSDAITAIDDFSSMVTNMEFFGSNTKQYQGKTDTPFCTVPVKYQFKDRDTRVFAEKTLRDTCGVQCSTPYPLVVREAIKQVVKQVKKDHPEDYIKVNVMVKEFGLKVARRPKGKDLDWIYYQHTLPLPSEALDITLKKLPENLRFALPIDEDDDMQCSTPPPKSPISGGSTSPVKASK